MRVIIAALSVPCTLNGVSRHAANLVRGLLSLPDAPEIHFVAGDWQWEMYPPAIARSDPNFHMHWIQIPHTDFSRIAWYYRELPFIAAQLEADVVHMTCPAPIHAAAVQCPTVVSVHDLYPFDIPPNFGFLRSQISRRLMKHCFKRAGAIACVSAFTRTRLEKWFGPAVSRKAVTIPNPVELMHSSAQRPPRELRARPPFILCIAQHRRNKNVPEALRIFKCALDQRMIPPHSKLLVLGNTGPETHDIYAEIHHLELETKVLLMRGITEAELMWCYGNAALLLAPSTIEGFGLPIAEALMAGCPVVCSDIPAFREVGGNHCSYIAFGDGRMEAYMNAIERAFATARHSALSMPELAPDRIAGKYMDLYRQLCGFPESLQSDMLRHPAAEIRESPLA